MSSIKSIIINYNLRIKCGKLVNCEYCRRCGFSAIIPQRPGDCGEGTSTGRRARAYSIQPALPAPVPIARDAPTGPLARIAPHAPFAPLASIAPFAPNFIAPIVPYAEYGYARVASPAPGSPSPLARSAPPAMGPLPLVPSGCSTPTFGPSSCPAHFIRCNSFAFPAFYDQEVLL